MIRLLASGDASRCTCRSCLVMEAQVDFGVGALIVDESGKMRRP